MKRKIVLLIVALMSAVIVNAKTVRGYVSDKDGNPVVGMKKGWESGRRHEDGRGERGQPLQKEHCRD